MIEFQSAESALDRYSVLLSNLRALLAGEIDLIANSANTAALLFHSLPDLNWAGFYFLRNSRGDLGSGEQLVLGPFQGKVACVRIVLGKGVCGTAAKKRETIVVPDVDRFPGHIACDSASRSEIAIPFAMDGRLIGVLDLDSPILDRFKDEDAKGLEEIVRLVAESATL
jgi:L-methionine (R)-S-oxide reductase